MSNSVLKAIAERYSCRGYTEQVPTDEQLKAIADAAVMAPSAMNLQPWKIIVIKDRDILNDLESDAIEYLANLENKAMYERIMSRGGRYSITRRLCSLSLSRKAENSTAGSFARTSRSLPIHWVLEA